MNTISAFFKKKWVRMTGAITLATFKWLIIFIVLGGIVGGGAAFGYVSALVKDDPVRSRESMMQLIEENSITGFVHFADDTIIGQLRTDEDRRMAKLSDIPQVLLDAVLAIEDNSFYEHFGIDVRATTRAVFQKVLKDDVQTGGSTITQQLARRVFLTLDRDEGRKAKEILLAMRMERLMSKEEILLAYLNKIPYGNGSSGYNLYGVKAAAKGIFDIDDLSKLNVAQAAYLAGLPQLPSNYTAFTSKGEFDQAGFNRAVARQRLVLKRMLEEGKITSSQHDEAVAFDLKGSLAKPQEKAYNTYPYLMIEAEREATEILLKQQKPDLDPVKHAADYKEAYNAMHEKLLHGGYRVYTTIDKTIYDAMRDIAENPKNFLPNDPKDPKKIEQVGAIMLDNRTSAILGMIEGRDFQVEQLNHATQALRQPGSTMKPIAAFIPALEKGLIQPASVIDDVPVILKDGSKNSGGYHLPENWDNKFHGLITARRALNQSYNIPAIKLYLDVVGINQAWDFAKKMGITSIHKDDYSAQTGVIGGLKYGTSVKELTNAYATIANKGVFNEAHMIRKITDPNGKIIYEHKHNPNTVFSPQTAYLMTDMLRTVITEGTATDLKSKFAYYGQIPVVGKTGSTQDDTDAWFEGFSPDITTGVWIGYDQPVNKLSKRNGSTEHAKNIWAQVMNVTVERRNDLFKTKSFEKPDGIVSATVSNLSGKLPSELTTKSGHAVTDIFNKDYVPTEQDDVMVGARIIAYNGRNYLAQSTTPDDMTQNRTVIKRAKPINQLLDEIQSIMAKLPPDRQRSIDSYKPLDYDSDAPSEMDPRTDDGKEPAPPAGLTLARSAEGIAISFQASPSADVVGYRLYRSDNRGPYRLLPGKVVTAGPELKLTDTPPVGTQVVYAIKAVDVAGNESTTSIPASPDGPIDPLFLPQSEGSGADPLMPEGAAGQEDAAESSAAGNKSNDGGSTGAGKQAKTAPSTPVQLTVKPVQNSGVSVSWKPANAKDRIVGYNVYYSDKENGTFKKIGSTPSNSTEFRSFAKERDGYYRITAYNESGESKPTQAEPYASLLQ
ncbi:transglycosylase domain-containing protein [Paenibacillus chartarius]|uniref:Transglycosylase domain-containing protein n=1 Tax=Paenibacillus chartarius TaxID=747481 RepID=A0ABV6DKK5_9BACL